MTAQAHDTITPVTTARPERRAGVGVIQLTRRDPSGEQPRIAVRELPAIAFLPEPPR